jgi:hypothetical protein
VSESNQTADPRIEHARQVLAGYDRGRWTAEVNLIGHLAGAVRQLLEVVGELAVTLKDAEDEDRERDASHVDVEGGAWFTPADALTVAAALDDAAELLRDRISYCLECGDTPLCDGCTDRLARADAYDALGRTLRGDR